MVNPPLIFPDDFEAVVSRTAVDYKVFEIRIPLQQNRSDGLFDKPALIERGSDHTDLGPRLAAGRRPLNRRRFDGPWPARPAIGRRRQFI
jgi:hypothetical protein